MEKNINIPEYNVTLYTKLKGDKSYKATDFKGNQVANLIHAPLVPPDKYIEFRKGVEETAKENPDTEFQIREFKTDKVWYDSNKDKPKPQMDKDIITQNIKDFVSPAQISTIQQGLKGEEKSYFEDILTSLDKTIQEMPKVYETDGIKLKDKIAQLHYFSGSSDWYIVEKDSEPEQLQAFGYVILNGDMQNAELGYISIEELKKIKGVEIDLHFTPKKLGEIIEKKDPEAKKESPAVPELKEKPVKEYKKDLSELIAEELVKYKADNKSKQPINEISKLLRTYWENIVSKHPEEFTSFLEIQKNLPAKVKPMAMYAFEQEWSEEFKDNLKTNLWELIPSEFKAHKMPKKMVYTPNHEDKGLIEIIKPFVGHDDLRPVLNGVDFNKHGIVATDAHKLLFLYHPDEAREEKNYCITNDCLKINENKKTIDGKYPRWDLVIPDNKLFVSIHTETLIAYSETVIDIKYFNPTVKQILISFNEDDSSSEMGFNAINLLEAARAMYKLGYDQIDVGYSSPDRAIVLCPKGRIKEVVKFGTDFALIMPIMITNDSDMSYLNEGTMYFNMEIECVSTKGIADKSCLNPIVVERVKHEKILQEVKSQKEEAQAINENIKRNKATDKEIKKLSKTLMKIDGEVWNNLNISSGSQLYSDSDIQEKYKEALDKKIKEAKIDYPLDMDIQDVLEDANFHSLNQYLTLSGAFGEEEKSKWIEFLEKTKSKENFLNLHVFSPEPMPEKLTKEVLASRLKILKKMDEKNPSAILKTRIKIINKMLANPEKFCCGGSMEYNNGGSIPENLVSELKNVFPKPIEEFGITEIFIDPYGEVRMTSNYDIPMDYAEAIEGYVLNKYIEKYTNEDVIYKTPSNLGGTFDVRFIGKDGDKYLYENVSKGWEGAVYKYDEKDLSENIILPGDISKMDKGGGVGKYNKGDEGMFEGDEVRILKVYPDKYAIANLDSDGSLSLFDLNIREIPMSKLDNQFSRFTKHAKGGEISDSEITQATSKYGWSAIKNDSGDYELFNRKNTKVVLIKQKGNKYTLLDIGGNKLMDGRGMIGKSIERLLTSYYYATPILNQGGSIDKFQVGDLVYNKDKNTLGIVRDVYEGEEHLGEIRTDADGNVNVDDLELYHPNIKAHKYANIAPSTKAQLKYVIISEKDGYTFILTGPHTKEWADNNFKLFTRGLPKGEKGKIVTLDELKGNKKIIGDEYLKFNEGGEVSCTQEDINNEEEDAYLEAMDALNEMVGVKETTNKNEMRKVE